jgi:hypothetical protein
MRAIWASFFLILSPAFGASRITGTYVCHGPRFAEMLQLTAAKDGGVNGVLSSVEIKQDGEVTSQQVPITGTVDGEQLTLSGKSLLSSLFGASLAGTITGDTIRLQTLDSKGNVSFTSFVRSTPAQFKAYADELKSRVEAVKLSRKLLSSAQKLRDMINSAEAWMASAEMHAGRIPNAKAAYERVEDQMRALVDQERRTSDPNARIQISLKVGQGDLAGERIDLEVDQIWDITIGSFGKDITQTFANWNADCGTAEELQNRGASWQAVESWLNACKEMIAERTRFNVVYRRVMQQRTDLKSYEASTQARRKALVEEASRIE